MPLLRLKSLSLFVCLLLVPLSAAEAATASFSVGIRIVPLASAASQRTAKPKAIKIGGPETSKTIGLDKQPLVSR